MKAYGGNKMTKLLLASALAGGLFVVPAAAQSIGGSYSVSGTNLDGSHYSGEAEIKLLSDTTCSIEWKTGDSSSEGICSRNDNAFAAAYVLDDVFGLVVYKVQPDGSLDGLWTIAGKDGNGTEVLTPK